ncbi:MAG: rhodanese-like domain-containing protein [Thermus caldifontis]
MRKLAWFGLLLVLPVLAQATTAFSPTTVRELGRYLETLPTDYYGVSPTTAKQMMDTLDVFILDVREPAEFKDGRIPGAVNIPIRELPKRIGELPKGKPIIVYCKTGNRGGQALVFLRVQGYNAKNLSGGIEAWKAANLPVAK